MTTVVRLLGARYGTPRHGNPRRPLDDLFYILLSNKTTPASAERAYVALRRKYPSWSQIASRDRNEIQKLIEPAGLSRIRAAHIVGIVEQLRRRFGAVTLAPLVRMSPIEAEALLVELPGVSLKVAKCVLMYTLAHRVLPVDTHVHRISRRLGWTTRKRADQCHAELEEVVPPALRFAYHVRCLAHGRAICRPIDPECDSCVIRRYCAYERQKAAS